RAEENYGQARKAVDQMLTQVSQTSLAHAPHMEKVRRALLQDALQFYQWLLRQKGTDPEVRQQAALACWRVGGIQKVLGDAAAAQGACRRALALQGERAGQFPQAAASRHERALSHQSLGRLLRDLRRPREAEQEYRRALAAWEELARASGGPAYRQELAH